MGEEFRCINSKKWSDSIFNVLVQNYGLLGAEESSVFELHLPFFAKIYRPVPSAWFFCIKDSHRFISFGYEFGAEKPPRLFLIDLIPVKIRLQFQ